MMSTVGRFAPSPSGRMHLGNVFTALLSWLDAKADGGRWILRIEDLDPQRSKPEWSRLIEDDLQWLGLPWDEGGLANPNFIQSCRTDLYDKALQQLDRMGVLYACTCTRADIAATQAPHAADGRRIYAGTCRPPHMPCPGAYGGRPGSVRLFIPSGSTEIADRLQGSHVFNPAADGDIVLRRADGAWSYQLAVVVDDGLMGVNSVVRGADLLESAARQCHIARLLGYPAPRYMHVPLLCNAAGQRLSKRDGSLAMDALRTQYNPQQLVGRLAHLAGLLDEPQPCTPTQLLDIYAPHKLRRTPTLQV